jgi:hypothetical protein
MKTLSTLLMSAGVLLRGSAGRLLVLLPSLLLSLCGVNPAIAGKDVFTRTKPHVNVGAVDGEPAVMWFHANAQVSEDGKKWGFFDIGTGIGAGQTVELVWDKATDNDACEQYFKVQFADGEWSDAVKFNFCEKDLILEFN